MNYPKNRYSGDSPWMNRDWLYHEYVELDKSSQEIADENGCKRPTIQSWLAKLGVKKDVVKRNRKILHAYQDRDYLVDAHLVQMKSITEIANENGVSYDCIVYNMKRLHIDYWVLHPKRTYTEDEMDGMCSMYVNDKMSTISIAKVFGCEHSMVRNILLRRGITTRNLSEAQMALFHDEINPIIYDKDELYRLHWMENISCKDMESILGMSASTIRRHMHSLGLKTKNQSESKRGLMTGEKHHNWKGGITPLYMLLREFFNTNLAPVAAKRDNYTCQLCGAEHVVLHVHHKIAFKKIVWGIINQHPELDIENNKQELYDIITHDDLFLDINNLVTLCKDCHRYKVHNYKRKR